MTHSGDGQMQTHGVTEKEKEKEGAGGERGKGKREGEGEGQRPLSWTAVIFGQVESKQFICAEEKKYRQSDGRARLSMRGEVPFLAHTYTHSHAHLPKASSDFNPS